ncbi:MAG: hypothetical protein H6617_09065 [Bdellovibrionaceae bacterium]|nr:hypothetical protein [Pseudobdellovibrionaceae bacterium]
MRTPHRTLALLGFFFLVAKGLASTISLEIPKDFAKGIKDLPFISHTGPGAFDNALALNVPYPPIRQLRSKIEEALGLPLDHFKGWNREGEAHVTVITPPEYANILKPILSMDDIHELAKALSIQQSDLKILGIGSGKKRIGENEESTFFLLVDSYKLRKLRLQIWRRYVKKGGKPQDWDPTWFFPHVTIGFTKTDLHEPDVLKDIKHAYDPRFKLRRGH